MVRSMNEHSLSGKHQGDRDAVSADSHEPTAVVLRFVDEVINGGNLAAVDELWAPDLRWHAGSLGDVTGIAAYKAQLAAAVGGAFSGMHLHVHDVIADEAMVVLRFTNSGDHVGEFLGVPATGRHLEWFGIGIYRIEHGKIAEAWFAEDMLGLTLAMGASLPETE